MNADKKLALFRHRVCSLILLPQKKEDEKIMRYPFIFAAVAILALSFAQPSLATTQWNLGVSIGNEGVNGFHFSVGEYYRVPEREVVVVRKRGIPDEELPVVFLLASPGPRRPRGDHRSSPRRHELDGYYSALSS